MNENTIKYKLNRIEDATDRIRVKVGVTEGTIEEVATAVENIEGVNDYFNVTASENSTVNLDDRVIGGWYYLIRKLPKVKNKLTNYDKYFYNLPFDVDLTELDTSIATSMKEMFSYCKVKTLDVSNFDTSNVTNMMDMFSHCRNITSLDLSNFDTSKITSTYSMFCECTKLESIDLRNWDTSNVTDMSWMFTNCNKLKYIDMRTFDFTNVTNYTVMFNAVPNNCLIIVKDDTQKTWITSKFSNLTNVKTVAEYGSN